MLKPNDEHAHKWRIAGGLSAVLWSLTPVGCDQGALTADDDSPTATDDVDEDAQAETEDGGDSSSTDDGGAPPVGEPESSPTLKNVEEYFPLVDGAWWSFLHTHRSDGQWQERVTMTEVTHNGETAWEVSDTPDLDDEITIQTWQQTGSLVSRVYREQRRNGFLVINVTYDPGFVRFDSDWTRVGAGELNTYVRDETKADGTKKIETRNQDYEVVSTNAAVSVPAGDFEACIEVRRTREDTGAVSHFWFARGVGKVKEEDAETLTLEELVDFNLPD
jgi:hypothetical protein